MTTVHIKTARLILRTVTLDWAYGLDAIPTAWCAALHGEWPLRSGIRWDAARLVALADRLREMGAAP